MRRALLLVSALAIAASGIAAGAQAPNGASGTQRSYNLSGFNSVSLAGPHDVVVNVGRAHSVRAQGSAELLDRLQIEVEGRKLKIGMKKGNWSRQQVNRGKATIYVTMPAIEAAAIAGSGDMRIDRVEGNRFSASIGGSGDMNLGALRVGEADFSVAGSGAIRGSGSARKASVSVAGSGDVDLAGLETRTSSVSIVGSGDVRARAMDTASVSIMGSGDVSISGPAKCSVRKMGSGSLRCGG